MARFTCPTRCANRLNRLRAIGEPGGGDRFTATLLVGQRLEPWLVDVTPLAKATN